MTMDVQHIGDLPDDCRAEDDHYKVQEPVEPLEIPSARCVIDRVTQSVEAGVLEYRTCHAVGYLTGLTLARGLRWLRRRRLRRRPNGHVHIRRWLGWVWRRAHSCVFQLDLSSGSGHGCLLSANYRIPATPSFEPNRGLSTTPLR